MDDVQRVIPQPTATPKCGHGVDLMSRSALLSSTHNSHMSILRQTTRCGLNQDIYYALNAFVAHANYIPEKTGEVTARLKSGQSGCSEAPKAVPSHAYSPIEKLKSKIDGQLIAAKDNICTIEEPTTCASAILDGFVSPYAATVVEKIEHAGAVVVGKTNMDEFGMGYAYGRPSSR